jgi:hypothetical protein
MILTGSQRDFLRHVADLDGHGATVGAAEAGLGNRSPGAAIDGLVVQSAYIANCAARARAAQPRMQIMKEQWK